MRLKNFCLRKNLIKNYYDCLKMASEYQVPKQTNKLKNIEKLLMWQHSQVVKRLKTFFTYKSYNKTTHNTFYHENWVFREILKYTRLLHRISYAKRIQRILINHAKQRLNVESWEINRRFLEKSSGIC